jgi:hypothetical protein
MKPATAAIPADGPATTTTVLDAPKKVITCEGGGISARHISLSVGGDQDSRFSDAV